MILLDIDYVIHQRFTNFPRPGIVGRARVLRSDSLDMGKPTSFPQWSTDQNFTGGAENGTPTKVEPSSGKKAEGWEPGEEPACTSFNWWMNNVGEWQKYFGYRVGRINRIYTDWRWLTSDSTELLGSTPSAQPTNTAIVYTTGVWALGTVTGADSLDMPLQLPVGSKIISWKALLNKTSASGTITAKLLRRVFSSGTVNIIDSANNSANNPGAITLGTTLASRHTVVNTEEYYIGINPGGVTGDTVRGYSVTVLLPPQMLGESHWSAQLTATGTVSAITNPTTGGLGAQVNLPANADEVKLFTSTMVTAPNPAQLLNLLEWEMDTTELVGTPGLTWRAGFSAGTLSGVSSTVDDTVVVEKTSASANYFLRTTTGSTSTTGTTDSGVAAASGVTRFRIMWFGSSVDSGGARVELYINDALVATRTTTQPNNGAMNLAMQWLSTGATTSLFDLSPVQYGGMRRVFTD